MGKEIVIEKESSKFSELANYFLIIASIVTVFGSIYLIVTFIFWFEFLHNDAMYDLYRNIVIGAFITALGLASIIYINIRKKRNSS
ncbi:MAG: hypothetical protein FK734_03415 [Asgard group archaeon]|nr:hypothetical protein [Asgard group archaeon]